jgi:hypothetical protein
VTVKKFKTFFGTSNGSLVWSDRLFGYPIFLRVTLKIVETAAETYVINTFYTRAYVGHIM